MGFKTGDDYYKGIKSLIQCKYCNKILKDPMMCKECQGAYCNNCIDELTALKMTKNLTITIQDSIIIIIMNF